ncbi:histidine triad nucleotide-binding protein [Motiliproteus sp. SC1-56]|uniref:histidine triad nucleotide-binding protein n=1 Tax=Motiliproteus sp. SC1-56 TaxID=2799565 RepID=UPI001A8F386D|nr:histidine triad nucleotide-binding protein [Motiliproteus sp. SC1-56]
MDCLFCKILDKEIPADIVYEDDQVIAFRDINPQAPSHLLVIPRQHIATSNDIQDADCELVGRMHLVAAKLARQEGFADSGYRTVMNCQEAAGQTVFHIHLHVLGGKPLGWPPYTERPKTAI